MGDNARVPAQPYDAFAPHFDAWQRAFGAAYDDLILTRVLQALRVHAPSAQTVVDLGIGTGDLVLALARHGYRVVGVDRSRPMLAVAAAKARAAGLRNPPVFYEQDVRTLNLSEPVDAAICVYTVINQLTVADDLARAFASVHAALLPGGVFLFELNLPVSYARYWSGTEVTQLADGTIVRREHRREATGLIILAEVTIQQLRDGRVEEARDQIAQRPYADHEIESALASTGFTLIACERFNPFAPADEPCKALWVVRKG